MFRTHVSCIITAIIFIFPCNNGQGQTGVYLSLKGMVHPNNSVILITEVGKTDTSVMNGLQCITDKRPCCSKPNRTGEWYFPGDGGMVPKLMNAKTFYRNRGDNGAVNLNRLNDSVTMPTGRFCCEIPDATDSNVTLCATIVYIKVIDGGTTPDIGASYNLSCAVSGTDALTRYQWRKDGVVSPSKTGPTLFFSSLMLSDAGQYSCGNGTLFSNPWTLTLKVPTPTVNIISNPAGIIAVGSHVTLTCTVELSPSVDVPVTVTTVWTGPARFMAMNTSEPVAGSTATYNSTVMLSSFERDQSGEYNCTVTISSMSSFIINSVSSSSTTRVTVGARVYLSLKGVVYPNNSVILITEIGETGTSQNPPPHSNNGLQCITDKMPCCVDESKAGEWYFPDSGGMVPIRSSAATFYRNRGGDGTVNLNRLNNNITMPTGRFCCEVADATDSIVTVCAITVYINITDGGTTPVIGASYNLTCAVSGTDAFSSYQWRKDGVVIPDQAGPTYFFSFLMLSDSGQYSCGNGTLLSENKALVLEVPAPVVNITSPSGIITAGGSVTLICTVELTPSVDVPVTVTTVWTGPARFMATNTSQPVAGSTTTYNSTVMLSSFERDQSGEYNCTVTISSMSSFIINSVSSSSTTRVTAGARVYLSLKGVVYPNNSVILITEIGETGTSQNPPPHPNNGLQCITDKMPCCVDESKAGEWYFPDSGGMVPIRSSAATFYRNRGGDGTVNLNRLNNNITMPTGRFCCEVADATDSIVTVCAITVYINITDGGTTPVVGASYNLTCAVSGTDAFSSYQWRKDGVVIPDQTGPTYFFSFLMLSDSGQYSCGNGTLLSENKALVLEVPAPVVNITSPSGIITAGGSVTLICTVELTPSVDVPVTVTTVWTGPARFMATNTSQPVAGSTTTYNSTVMLSSFERDQSGEYNCTVTISSMSSFIINSVSSSSTTRVTAGARVYLSLKGVVYPNNSVILITEIGETGTSQNPPPHPNNGLQCITDKMPCCVDESKAGEWYFPDSGGMVPIRSSATTFYRNRGGDGTVNLNRLNNNITMPTGRFCCEVADATDSIVTVCAIIVYINITDGGTTPVVGASYNLTCAVSSTEAFTSYQWRKDGAVIPDKTGPTLSFSPLNISNFGQYSCGNGTLFSNLWTLTLEVRIFIAITTSGTNTVGDNYKLKCSVTVAGSIEAPTITWLYGMTKITSNSSMTLSETSSDGSNGYSSTLTFYSLSASHAGNYSCRANVSGGMQTGTKIVTVQIPSPNVSITSNPTGLIAIGGSVTLKCTVLELSPSAGVQVTVSTEWTGPDGFMATNLSQPVMGNTTTTVVLSSFGRDQSGEYTCTATVNSMSPFIISSVLSSSTTRVTVGVYLSLNRVVYPNNSVILITDIGKSPNSGLQCVTDRMSCCSALPNRAGEWYFPSDEGIVPGPLEVPTTFYRNRGDDGTVNLNRINNVIMPTGKFCCEVPDAIDMTVTLCAIIVYINIGGDGATPGPVIGQSYKLTCAVSGSDAFTTYRWRKDGVMIPGETGPTLTLSPLRLPHAGLYSCGNGTLFSDNWALVLEVRVSVAITTSGTSTAGETYNLECSVTVAGSIETPTITWLFGMTEITSDSFTTLSETASNGSNGYFRMLTFDPLSASHAGNYSCKAAVSGEIQTGITMVTVQNTTITVRVESRVAVPVAGSTYSFNCTVTGAERLTSSTITYRWFKGGLMVADKRVKTFAFTPVSFSDAGGYTCQVTVMSDLLSVPITANSSNSINVTLILPPPSTVTVISPSRIIAGSSVNMSCIVGIPNSVKNSIPANVNAAWTVPDNVIVSPTSTKPIVGNQTNYTLSANFVRVSSGNYTCYANLRSASLFITTSRTNLGTISVDVAPLPPPTDLVIANTTAMSISLNWAQPEGAHAVDRYEISYSFVVAECVRDGVTTTDPTVTVILNEGFRRSYTISNSSATPVEEDSQYTISLRATNAIATSEKVSINMTSTLTAEPTGPPRNISIISTNSTNITIQWDEVECRERNGLILGYQVQISENVVKNTTKRNFTVSGLLPRTEYAFSVSAINNISNGSCGSVTVNTSVPLQVGFLLGGNAYGNNSIVNISDIGNNSEALHCITNRVNCCGRMDSGGIVMGEWYFPNNGSAVGTMRENGSIYRNRGPSVVRLNRRSNAMMTDGVFRCEIPDASDTNQSIYVGVYSLGKGAPTINEPLEYSCDMDEQVIICTSMGGPATNVQWWKDHKLLSVQSDQHQRIVNTSNSVYQNVLVLGQRDPDEVVGNYTCGVSNIRGEANGTILLHGIQTSVVINEDDGSMSINCTTDLAFTAIEWLDHNYHVLVNTSTEPYLEFSIVQDDEFLCRVTSSFGSQNKSLSLSLPTELSPSSAVYGAPVAVVMVLLMVTVVVVLVVLVTFKRSRKHQMRLYHVSVDISPQHKPSHSPPYESNDSLAVSLTHVSTEVDAECIELKECSEIVEGKEENTYAEDVTAVASEDLKAVPVSEFNSHVVSFHANRDKLFEREYTSISKNPQSPHIVGELPYNKNKNRFGNIFPYDTSRVKLKEIPGEEGSDYINASYVNGYNKRKAYIAAQGPMPNTVTDFWRMIWEKKLPTIVMLTRCFEGRKKCEEYWPVNVGECVEPGHGLNVTLTSLLPFAEYSVRKMTVTRPTVPNSVPLRLVHFHFTSWPDHGVPQNGVVLINFIKRVRSAHPYTDTRPLLVHCSAGVGRTGAFIVLDSMLQRMKVEENFNIFEFVIQLRAQRVLMVQTQSQYNFIHDALNEVTLCGDTEISASDLRVVVSRLSQASDGETGYSNQFNLLNQMSPATSEADYTQANMECNVSKNRYINVLPNDHYRVMLRATTVPGSDYINASFVDGYKQRGAYIASQTPLENTISDFWKMILEYRSRTIVVVNEEVSHTYLPEHIGECEVYGKVLVKVVSQQNSTDYIIRQLEIFEDKPHPQGFVPSPHPVTMFHFMCWPQYSIPQVTSTFLQLIEDVNRAQMSSGNKPITVMCNDGVGRTGTFICIHAQLERLKTEGVVDFFQSIKSARIQRAGLVSDIQQYIFCHSVVADYLDGFDTYANFKELV